MLITSMLIWGSLAIFVKNIPYSSAEIVMFRIALGLLFLAVVFKATGQKLDIQALKRHFPRLLVSGMFMGLNWVALFESYIYVDVSIATLCYYCAPVFVIVGSVILFKENFGIRKAIAVLGAAVGMVIVTGVNVGGSQPFKGIAFALISAVLYSLVALFNKTFRDINGMQTTMAQLIGAGIIVTPYALASHWGAWVFPSATGLACILVLGFLHTGVALYFYFSSIQTLPAQSVAFCSYIDPVSALIFAAVFLGERMSLPQILGAILIIGSAAFGEIKMSSVRSKRTDIQ